MAEAGRQAADRRRRRKLLAAAYVLCAGAPTGLIPARTLVDAADSLLPEGQGFRGGPSGDGEALTLIRDLVTAGLLREEAMIRRRGQLFGLDHLRIGMTEAGASLHLEQREPHRLVDDERVMD
jgi:hypothetical protein